MRPRMWPRRPVYFPRMWALPLVLLAGLFAWSVGWVGVWSHPIAGHALAVDGDTLRIGGQRVRLTGIDAPELDQTCRDGSSNEWRCGEAARTFLVALLKGRDATCARSGRDVYGRTLATCTIEGRDVGAQLVAAGWALSDIGYPREEADARAAQLGIWSGSVVLPADWRRSHGVPADPFWEWIRSWFQ